MNDYQSPYGACRRRVVVGAAGFVTLASLWVLMPGLPVMRAPHASGRVKEVGLTLFRHEWRPHDPLAKGDGLGPVFNARSCVECHSQGGVGGGGDNSHNVLTFEAFPTQDRPEVEGGLVHRFAVENRFLEGQTALHDFFPVVPNGVKVEAVCQTFTRDFDPVHTQSVNSTALFGAGWVDRISPKTIWHNGLALAASQVGKEIHGDFSGATPGRARVLPDGRLGKFGWKAQFATLEDFVAAACANEIGLGNPKMEQARPMVRWNYPKVERDLGPTEFRALVAFVDTLPRPLERVPDEPARRAEADRGKAAFVKVGCAACHTPEVGGVAGVYSDFLLHRLNPPLVNYRETPPAPLPHEFPLPEEWKTPPLWGVADSAPYFHDGASATLEQAIARHNGDAENVTAAFNKLHDAEQRSIVAFLRTLKAPADATPAPPSVKPAAGRLALAR